MPPHIRLPRVTSVSSLGTGSFHHAVALDSHCHVAAAAPKEAAPALPPDARQLLGGEPGKLDAAVEYEGVLQILEALSAEERAALPDPRMPVRHLRAEDGDVEMATEKLRAALRWRAEFGVPHVVDPDDEDMRELLARENATGKIYVRGHDRQGRAMVYMRPARENCGHNLEGNMRHLVWNLEKAIACTRRRSLELGAPVPLEKIILIIDYDGFRLRDSPPLATSKYTLDVLQKHYPERMHRAYVVHPPLVFSSFWAVIKNFIDPATKEKIVFVNKKTIHKLQEVAEDVSKLEDCAGGDGTAKEFNSKEYLSLPFDVSFDA